MNNIPISDIVYNNLLSPEEISAYLRDSLRFGSSSLKQVVAHIERRTLPKTDLVKIPHHRYELYLEAEETLHIAPIEGLLRMDHLKLQVACLSEISGQPIGFEVRGTPNIVQAATDLMSQVDRYLAPSEKMTGIIIGSLWNFNFFTNMRLRPDFFQGYLSPHKKEVEDYTEYRINQIVIEQLVVSKKLALTQTEQAIFRQGYVPSQKDKQILAAIIARIQPAALTCCREALRQNTSLLNYLMTDYLFFVDLRDGTHYFEQTLSFPETVLVEQDSLSFQVLRISGRTYINFSWSNAAMLGEVIKQLQQRHPIEAFYMYGKCGSLSEDIPPGSITAPSSTVQDGDQLFIQNQVTSVPLVPFYCIESPLLETKTWAAEMEKKGVCCVEMELYPVIKSLSDHVKKWVIYYASDAPLGSLKIAQRFDFLQQRIDCIQLLLNEIVS